MFNPHSLNAMVLINSADASIGREFQHMTSVGKPACGSEENPLSLVLDELTIEPKHFHAPKRLKAGTGLSRFTPSVDVLRCPVAPGAFRAASLVRERSDTSRFFDNAAYNQSDVADFIIRSLRNRARSLSALKRISNFAELFYIFATGRADPYPFVGDASLLCITLWLHSLIERGATIPNFGKYPLRLFGGNLGYVSPSTTPP